ncbi:enoyl-CoA hydratase/isomerase family protein [bacterium]|nr:enoyl-CoA hydratase/isomerase family protein [bacterium]
MTYETLKIESSCTTFIIALNRPDKLNSFNQQLSTELINVLSLARDDESIRAIIITGMGRAFSAGQDLQEFEGSNWPKLGAILQHRYNPIVELLRTIPKPIIAAVNGPAAGAGANLALMCDLVIAAEESSLMQAFIHVGLVPDTGGTFILPRLVGMHQAFRLAALGEKLTAQDAFQLGLVYKVVAGGQLMEEAQSMASKLALLPTQAIGHLKEALNSSLSHNLFEQLEMEVNLQTKCGETADFTEGVKSFLEKRKPHFIGK